MPQPQYKAMMIDVDGTLLIPGQKLPSERVTQAIQQAKETMHIGIASSRPLYLVEPIFHHLKLTGPAVLCGGALIVDMATGKILKEHIIGQKTTETICKLLAHLEAPFFIHDNGKDVDYSPSYVPNKPQNIIGWKMPGAKVDAVLKELKKIPSINAYKINAQEDDTYFIDITDIHATKQHGILEVAERLGISTHEIIGIGDGYNDFPLLMACGLKVAMENAVDDLKEIADYIAPSVHDDGVADVINKYIL